MTDFNVLAPQVISRLSNDLGLTPQQAAGIVGQLGHESAGLQAINERQPVVPGSRGGFGWAQWTGPRRRQFEAFAAERGLDVTGLEANYAYLLHELTNTPEGRVLDRLRQAEDAQTAGRIFTDQFLRPGVPAYDSRSSWTDRALSLIIPAAQAAQPPSGLSSMSDEELMAALRASESTPQVGGVESLSDDELLRLLGQQHASGSSASQSTSPDGVMRLEMSHGDRPAQEDTPQRSTVADLARQVGLTARAGVTGATGLASMGTNAVIDAANSLFGTSIPRADVGATLSAIGLPEPENATERIAQDVAGGLAGAGTFVGLGQGLAQAAGPVARGVGSLLSTSPTTQLASAAAGTGAAGAAREMGFGPGAQLGAGLVAGMGAPLGMYAGGALIRGLARGGEAGRQRVAQNIEAFRQAGTTPTVGQATERPIVQGIETILSQSPGGAGVMTRRAASQADDIAGSVGGIVGRLSPRAGSIEAGESIGKGLEGFKAGVKAMQNHLYNRLDDYIPPSTPIAVDRTRQALAALNSDIKGAPALSRMFKNARIRGIEKALKSDLGDEASTLPYEAIKKLRTLVGREIDNSSFVSDVPRDKWRALYGALSDDLGVAAQQAGPEAHQAWRWANQFTRDQMARLDDLAAVAGRDTPEKIFNAAMMGSQDGDTMLRRIVSAIPKKERRQLAAAVIQRMGRATPGNQNEVGEVFSTSTFLTNWNRLSPQARETLFGRIDDERLLSELANLAKVSTNIRDGSKYLANPSGSGAAAARQAMLGAGALAGITGNFGALTGILAAPVGGNLGARLMTSPSIVQKLANPTEMNVPMLLGGVQALLPK